MLAAALGCATPAAAQFSGSLSIHSQDRFRGQAVSQGRPTLALDLSYDHPSGFYVDVNLRGVLARHGDPELLAVEENVGFAKELRSNMSVDIGVTNSDYSKYYNGLRTAHYQEYYVGIITKLISAHIHYSPRYFGLHHYPTLYGDIDGAVPLNDKWRLTGHVGVLKQLSGPTRPNSWRTYYDYRLGGAVRLGAFDILVEWTGGGPGRTYYNGRFHSKSGLVAGANFFF